MGRQRTRIFILLAMLMFALPLAAIWRLRHPPTEPATREVVDLILAEIKLDLPASRQVVAGRWQPALWFKLAVLAAALHVPPPVPPASPALGWEECHPQEVRRAWASWAPSGTRALVPATPVGGPAMHRIRLAQGEHTPDFSKPDSEAWLLVTGDGPQRTAYLLYHTW